MTRDRCGAAMRRQRVCGLPIDHYGLHRSTEYLRRTKEQQAHSDRSGAFKRKYGITIEQYDKMLAEQGGVCALCRQAEVMTDHRTGKVRRLSVDHDHSTLAVRGLLCYRCNTNLGHYEAMRANPLLHNYLVNESEGI